MSQDQQILLLSENDQFIDALSEVLAGLRVREEDMAAGSLTQVFGCELPRPPHLMLIDLNQAEDTILEPALKLKGHFPGAKAIFIGAPADAAVLMKLVAAGYSHFVKFPPAKSDLIAFVAPPCTAPAAVPAAAAAKKENTTIVMFSPGGGSGVTLLAANLGVALTRKHADRVLACNLAYQCGDIPMYLDVVANYTIRDIPLKNGQIDDSFMQNVIQKHPTGLNILAGPTDEQESFSSNNLKELEIILDYLKARYRIVLIDAGKTDAGILQFVMMRSDIFILVGSLDIPSLKGLSAAYNRILRLGYDPDRVRIAINRYNAKNQLSITEFEKNVGRSLELRVPNDYALCIEAVNSGKSLFEIDETAEVTRRILQFAEDIENPGQKTPQSEDQGHSLAQRLSGLLRGKKT